MDLETPLFPGLYSTCDTCNSGIAFGNGGHASRDEKDSASLNYWVNLQGDSQEHSNTNHHKTMVGKGEKGN